jgi:protein-S-isoprenylcysteine O-methyltransferase Ste14
MRHMKPKTWTWSPEQLPFIMSGKWYLLAWLLVRATLAVLFIGRVWRGEPIVTPLAIAGAVLFTAGFALRRWSMRLMGERFRGYEVRREERGLESRGPYALVRHPGYLGLALMDIGLPLLLNLPWGLVLSMVLIALIVRRITLEEALLVKTYIEYTDFATTRKRLIPGVW